VIGSTLRALIAPRRLIPIIIVCIPLVVAQYRYTPDLRAVGIAILMVVAFVAIAPVSWRALMPMETRVTLGPLRVLAYGMTGLATIGFVGWVLPQALGIGQTFLTDRETLLVELALFVVGGWGLGRDIDLEAHLGRERARTAELAKEAERAQLLALRSHLDPHFLFNTLNAIAEWCREDGEVAERATLQLSSMLRVVLAGVRAPAWPLAKELALVDDFFALHRIRDPERFALERDVPDPVPDVEVPPMLLLPLAENAVKHGPGAGHAGPIRLVVQVDGEDLRVRIENPGAYRGPREGGEGVPMVQKRLAMAYEGHAQLELRDDGGTRTVAELRLPRRARLEAIT
jgi:hypothetical protein